MLKPKTASQGPWVCASGPVLLQLGGPRADGEGAAAPPPPLLCHGDVRGVYVVSLACSITQPCLNEGAWPAARRIKPCWRWRSWVNTQSSGTRHTRVRKTELEAGVPAAREGTGPPADPMGVKWGWLRLCRA